MKREFRRINDGFIFAIRPAYTEILSVLSERYFIEMAENVNALKEMIGIKKKLSLGFCHSGYTNAFHLDDGDPGRFFGWIGRTDGAVEAHVRKNTSIILEHQFNLGFFSWRGFIFTKEALDFYSPSELFANHIVENISVFEPEIYLSSLRDPGDPLAKIYEGVLADDEERIQNAIYAANNSFTPEGLKLLGRIVSEIRQLRKES